MNSTILSWIILSLPFFIAFLFQIFPNILCKNEKRKEIASLSFLILIFASSAILFYQLINNSSRLHYAINILWTWIKNSDYTFSFSFLFELIPLLSYLIIIFHIILILLFAKNKNSSRKLGSGDLIYIFFTVGCLALMSFGGSYTSVFLGWTGLTVGFMLVLISRQDSSCTSFVLAPHLVSLIISDAAFFYFVVSSFQRYHSGEFYQIFRMVQFSFSVNVTSFQLVQSGSLFLSIFLKSFVLISIAVKEKNPILNPIIRIFTCVSLLPSIIFFLIRFRPFFTNIPQFQYILAYTGIGLIGLGLILLTRNSHFHFGCGFSAQLAGLMLLMVEFSEVSYCLFIQVMLGLIVMINFSKIYQNMQCYIIPQEPDESLSNQPNLHNTPTFLLKESYVFLSLASIGGFPILGLFTIWHCVWEAFLSKHTLFSTPSVMFFLAFLLISFSSVHFLNGYYRTFSKKVRTKPSRRNLILRGLVILLILPSSLAVYHQGFMTTLGLSPITRHPNREQITLASCSINSLFSIALVTTVLFAICFIIIVRFNIPKHQLQETRRSIAWTAVKDYFEDILIPAIFQLPLRKLSDFLWYFEVFWTDRLLSGIGWLGLKWGETAILFERWLISGIFVSSWNFSLKWSGRGLQKFSNNISFYVILCLLSGFSLLIMVFCK